jgi:hypothetical protein
MSMTITHPDLQEVVRSLLDRWLASPPDDPVLLEAVRSCGALPVYADLGGILFLRPDGEILVLGCGPSPCLG